MKKLWQLILIIILIFLTFPVSAQKWEPFNAGLEPIEITCMTNNNEEVFIGTVKNGVFSSNILQNNWKAINNGIDTFSPGVHSIALVNNTIYASVSSGLFVSFDNGNSWDAVNDGYLKPGYSVVSSIISFSDKLIYSDGGSIFLSENKGLNWSLIGSGGIYRLINSLASNGKDVYAGTINGTLLFSSDGGNSWAQIHEFPSRIKSLTAEANVLIVGTDNGVYLSNNLSDWQIENDGLVDLSVKSIVIASKYLFAATNKGVFKAEKSSDIKWIPFNEGLTNFDVCCLSQSKYNLFAATHSGSVYKLDLTPLSVDDSAPQENTFSIHPNPATDYIYINFNDLERDDSPSNNSGSGSVKIFNTFGQCVSHLTPTLSKGEGVRIDVSQLPVGVYFVRVGNRVEKFVKW